MRYISLLKQQKTIVLDYICAKSKKYHNAFGVKYLICVSLSLCFIIGIVGAYTVVLAENGAENATITDFWNALYWTFSTFSTVGYGDMYPVTAMGKFISNIIMALGIGMYSFAISLITGLFIHNLINKSSDTNELKEQNARIEAKLDLVIEQVQEYGQQANTDRDNKKIQK